MSEGSDGGGDSRRDPGAAAADQAEMHDSGGNGRSWGMSRLPSGGDQDMNGSRDPQHGAGAPAAEGDTYGLYQRGMSLLQRGSAAAAAQLLERAAAAEPQSRSILEGLARAQFDAGRHAEAAGSFQRIVDASPSDDYAQFGLGLALARTGDHGGAAEHLALAAAMRPNLRHYTDALRSVRATLSARSRLREEPAD
jgi:tetratricopeptide (TPR) repeat protein